MQNDNRLISHILDNDQQLQEQMQFDNQKVEMIIQLDSENSATIMIHEKDDAYKIASLFCFKYNVDPRVINSLAVNIQQVQGDTWRTLATNNIHQTSHHHIRSNSRMSQSKRRVDYGGVRSKDKSNTHNESTIISYQQISVFDRLYADSRKKLNVSKGEQNNSIASKQRQFNCKQNNRNQSKESKCLQIYHKNTQLQLKNKLYNERLHQLYKQQQLKQCCHHPMINLLSEQIIRKKRQHCKSTTYNYYENYNYSKDKQYNRNKRIKQEKEKKEMQECTFNPKILKKRSNSNINNISTKTSRYKLLYDDYNLRETRKQIINKRLLENNQQRFKPIINKLSNNLIKNTTFQNRMKQNIYKKEQKYCKIESEIKKQYKHYPIIGKKPKNRTKGKLSIGEYLYSKHMMQKYCDTNNNNCCHQMIKPCKKSQKIYNQNKYISFRYLFTLMDSDNDGLISHLRIDINTMDRQILKLIYPLLNQMEQANMQLGEQQFIQAFEKLFMTFNIEQKNKIINIYKHRKQINSQQHSFKPELNDKSLLIAKQLRSGQKDLYELWMDNQIQKQYRIKNMRNLKQLEQYQQCTFQPILLR